MKGYFVFAGLSQSRTNEEVYGAVYTISGEVQELNRNMKTPTNTT